MNENKVVLFDGVCNLCNGFVQFIIRHDPTARFRFGTLQSESGKKLILESCHRTLLSDSVVYIRGDACLQKSTAALYILKDIGGIWKLTFVFMLVPKFLRDAVYDAIARSRYRLLGKRESCMIPTPGIKHRFLD